MTEHEDIAIFSFFPRIVKYTYFDNNIFLRDSIWTQHIDLQYILCITCNFRQYCTYNERINGRLCDLWMHKCLGNGFFKCFYIDFYFTCYSCLLLWIIQYIFGMITIALYMYLNLLSREQAINFETYPWIFKRTCPEEEI